MNMKTNASLTSWVFLFLIIGVVFVTPVRGGCLSFGHSCFGAHGKRSDGVYPPTHTDNNDNPDSNDLLAPPPAWLPLWKAWAERQERLQKNFYAPQ